MRLAGGSDSVAASKVALALEVRVPSEYPAVVPEVQVRVLKGVSSRSALELQTALRDEAQRSLGAPMVFTLAQMLKDWLDEARARFLLSADCTLCDFSVAAS